MLVSIWVCEMELAPNDQTPGLSPDGWQLSRCWLVWGAGCWQGSQGLVTIDTEASEESMSCTHQCLHFTNENTKVKKGRLSKLPNSPKRVSLRASVSTRQSDWRLHWKDQAPVSSPCQWAYSLVSQLLAWVDMASAAFGLGTRAWTAAERQAAGRLFLSPFSSSRCCCFYALPFAHGQSPPGQSMGLS